MSTFEPRKPAAGKTGFDKNAHDDHLMIFVEPKSEGITSQYGEGVAAHCSYAVCLDHENGPTIEPDPMVFGQVLVPALTDAGDELVVGRIGQASGKAGRTYWLLYDPTEEDMSRAKEWLDANATRSPASNRIMLDTSF